jgi:xanthine/uracil permease
MSEKLIALKRTLVMVVIACIAPLLIAFLLTLDSEQIGWTILGALFVYGVYIIYAINLNQVRYELTLKQSLDRIEKITEKY